MKHIKKFENLFSCNEVIDHLIAILRKFRYGVIKKNENLYEINKEGSTVFYISYNAYGRVEKIHMELYTQYPFFQNDPNSHVNIITNYLKTIKGLNYESLPLLEIFKFDINDTNKIIEQITEEDFELIFNVHKYNL